MKIFGLGLQIPHTFFVQSVCIAGRSRWHEMMKRNLKIQKKFEIEEKKKTKEEKYKLPIQVILMRKYNVA